MPQLFRSDQGQSVDPQIFELLVNELTDFVVFLTDPDGCIVSWNPGVENILGYSEAEWIGCSAEMIFTPEDLQNGVPQREMTKAAKTGRASDNRSHLKKNGERIDPLPKFVPTETRESSGHGSGKPDLRA